MTAAAASSSPFEQAEFERAMFEQAMFEQAKFERAIAYGDGLFETLLVRDGSIPLWSWHRQRLEQSLPRLQLAVDLDALEQQCQAFAAHTFAEHAGQGIIKLILARAGGPRGYDYRAAISVTRHLAAYPVPRFPRAYLREGIKLHLCSQRLAQNPVLAGIKHLNRLEQVLAAGEFDRQQSAEGLLLDSTGAVIEGCMSNLFIVRNGVLVTPDLRHCGVAGVMRALLLQAIAPAMGIAVAIERLTLADVLAADECFIGNSVFGIWPARALGVSTLAAAGPVYHQCWQALVQLGYDALYA
jgi:4-amino-4-deoxychorismate lyase